MASSTISEVSCPPASRVSLAGTDGTMAGGIIDKSMLEIELMTFARFDSPDPPISSSLFRKDVLLLPSEMAAFKTSKKLF